MTGLNGVMTSATAGVENCFEVAAEGFEKYSVMKGELKGLGELWKDAEKMFFCEGDVCDLSSGDLKGDVGLGVLHLMGVTDNAKAVVDCAKRTISVEGLTLPMLPKGHTAAITTGVHSVSVEVGDGGNEPVVKVLWGIGGDASQSIPWLEVTRIEMAVRDNFAFTVSNCNASADKTMNAFECALTVEDKSGELSNGSGQLFGTEGKVTASCTDQDKGPKTFSWKKRCQMVGRLDAAEEGGGQRDLFTLETQARVNRFFPEHPKIERVVGTLHSPRGDGGEVIGSVNYSNDKKCRQESPKSWSWWRPSTWSTEKEARLTERQDFGVSFDGLGNVKSTQTVDIHYPEGGATHDDPGTDVTIHSVEFFPPGGGKKSTLVYAEKSEFVHGPYGVRRKNLFTYKTAEYVKGEGATAVVGIGIWKADSDGEITNAAIRRS